MTKNIQKLPEEKLLDEICYIPRVFWAMGESGERSRIFAESKDKTKLFDLSFYEDAKNDPTIKYLKTHSVENILAGRTPDMTPKMVRIVEGDDGIIQIVFDCSRRLQDAGVDDTLFLNRDSEDPKFCVILADDDDMVHVVGYDKGSGKPYVRKYYPNGTMCHMTFEVVSSY